MTEKKHSLQRQRIRPETGKNQQSSLSAVRKERILSSLTDSEKMHNFAITLKHQDEASVISGRFFLKGDRVELSENISKALEKLAGRITENGGLIGHIKAAVTFEETTVYSVTLDKADIRNGACCTCEGILTVIIFLLDDEQAETFVREILTELISLFLQE